MGGREGTPVTAILLSGAVLAWPAAWNGYPLVFADTGTYLGQAILLYLGWDRPPFYSLFLHALHWRLTLWAIPLVQGLISAHLLALALRVLGRPGGVPLLLTALLLALATALPWFVAQLMPDVFTGLLVLAAWLLGFGWARLGRVERGWVMLLATGAVAVHFSHLALAGGLAVLAAVLGWIGGGARRGLAAAGRIALPVALAAVALATVNFAGHGRLALSPFGSVFLAARLIVDGPGARTLEARCGEEDWQACAVRGRLPALADDFLWPPDGPLRAVLGGGKAWAPEAAEIVAATLAREPGAVLRSVLRNGLNQFGRFATGDGLMAWRGDPGPEALLADHFPEELEAFRTARQQQGQLLADANRVSPLHVALGWLGLILLPVATWMRRRHLPALALGVMVLAASAGNALVTGGLSGVNDRYQARLAWLFVFAPSALLAGAPLASRREELALRG